VGRAERARYAAAVEEAAAADPTIVARVAAAADRLTRPVRREEPPSCSPGKLADYEWGRTLLAEGDEALRTAALWAHHEACRAMRPWHEGAHSAVCAILARRRLRWTVDEVRWAFAVLWAADPYAARPQQPLLLAAVEALPAAERPPLHEHVERLRTSGVAVGYGTAEETRRQRRIRTLLGVDDAASPTLPPSLLHDGDPYGPAVRAELADVLVAPGAVPLLVHCATAGGVLPPARWAATAATLLAAAPDGPALLRRLLERLRELPEWSTQEHWDGEAHTIWHWLHADTETLLRGVLWTVGALDELWVEGLLGEVALRCGTGLAGSGQPRAERLANTAVAWIGRRAGPDAVPTLTVLHRKVGQRSLHAGIVAALDRVAEGAGVSREHLLERSVPDFGLDASGRREHVLGGHVATLTAERGIALIFRTAAGRELKGVPAAVRAHHGAELAELRADVKALRATVAAQRDRLEDLLVTERTWDHADWARHYHDHPVVGLHARALIWELELGPDGWVAGWPQDGGFVDAAGEPLPSPGATTRMRLWHPMTVPAERTAAWRRFVTDRELRQPFKQAFREVYLLTPAELDTRVYSNRFAAHVVRAPQAGSLLTGRGWRSPHLGYWDGGSEGRATKEFDGWRAEFHFDGIETDGEDHLFSLAGTDQVRFNRGGHDWTPADLDRVPPRIFSEAMRDVDLVIGVASIAADPAWVDQGEDRHRDYWHRTSFGALGESAQARREALARLIPRTRIADRCTLGDRFLTVRGDLRTYRIHLGSTNILMEPNDSYLCIVTARDRTAELFLPFEEGGGPLSVIVSKAFLLASDATITDRTILAQIRRP
jgi:hypothetical protein